MKSQSHCNYYNFFQSQFIVDQDIFIVVILLFLTIFEAKNISSILVYVYCINLKFFLKSIIVSEMCERCTCSGVRVLVYVFWCMCSGVCVLVYLFWCTCSGVHVRSFNLLLYSMMKFLYCSYNCMDVSFMFPSNLLNFSTHFLVAILNIFVCNVIAVSSDVVVTCTYQIVKHESESNSCCKLWEDFDSKQ